MRAARRDAMPADAAGLRPGERSAVLGRATRHQRRMHAEPSGLQVADRLMAALPARS